MMLSPDRLNALLMPEGFSLRDVSTVTKTIRFVRPSYIPRLHEHLHVQGQGKVGEAVYATTAISGSSGQSLDACVAEVDNALLFILESDKDRHWTLIRTKDEAVTWEHKLANHSDSQCRAVAEEKGPALRERLQPAFDIVDSYVRRVGNIYNVFDSEFRYFSNASVEHRREAERLASLIGNIGEASEDVQLACLILFRFAFDVESQENKFRGTKWHEDAGLRVRIYLLVDFIRESRKNRASSQRASG